MKQDDAHFPIADDPAEIAAIHDRLIAWYCANRRDLPWRNTRDPYRILVSEVMLQQTQVERVIPKYHEFLERFPTIEALAAAPTAEVIRAWAGLGYNRRALNLQLTAQAVVERHDGVMPRDLDALLALPGIGRYTAGAILCFAYEEDVGFVDTNIRRVLHRLCLGPELPEPLASERDIQQFAECLVPASRGYEWNQALMEFGAVQCTARKPACLVCPLQGQCRAFPEIQSRLALTVKPVSTLRRKQEGPFEGSSRYYRGRVIAALRELPAGESIDLGALGPRVRPDYQAEQPEHIDWLRQVVEGLHRDGLAQVAEDPVPYETHAHVHAHTSEHADGAEAPLLRVRLP